MKSLNIALVDWALGTIIIGVFAVVCIVLITVIYSLTRVTSKATDVTITEKDKPKNLSI